MNKQLTGIVLLQMGGPDSLEDIPRFLYNLFSDRDIIKLGPAFLQKPIARYIAKKRAPKSRSIYEKIGGGSPLKGITRQQADGLAGQLENDGHFLVRVAMRYWQPRAEEALKELVDAGVSSIIALPLYPHYTKATGGSSLKDLRAAHDKLAPHIPLKEILSWPEQPDYIEAIAQRITTGGKEFGTEPFQLVYSAHSLPVSFIKEGDPYVDELKMSIEAIEKLTGIEGTLSYQSRSGPVEWLSPSTTETIDKLATKGCKNILMVPISFVSDHVETLYEINMEFRERAEKQGVQLRSTVSLNDDPQFIKGLRSLVLEAIGDRKKREPKEPENDHSMEDRADRYTCIQTKAYSAVNVA